MTPPREGLPLWRVTGLWLLRLLVLAALIFASVTNDRTAFPVLLVGFVVCEHLAVLR